MLPSDRQSARLISPHPEIIEDRSGFVIAYMLAAISGMMVGFFSGWLVWG